MRHILTVRSLLSGCASYLLNLGMVHDLSKLCPPEDRVFAIITERLAEVEYGSEEYKATLREHKEVIERHQKINQHHPEAHEEGVEGMDLFFLLEMLCDWKAASLRHETGDLMKSIEINAKRFGIPEAIVKILKNTVPLIEELSEGSALQLSYPHVKGE
jgi:hypothetical protein